MGLTNADIIWTDPALVEQGTVDGIELDLVVGDTDDFEATVPAGCAIARGSALVVDGTGWGGIVDDVSSTTTESRRTVSGRTWAGVLASRVVRPPTGEAYLEFDCDAHDAMRTVVGACDLSYLFHVPAAQSGIHVAGRFDRYVDAASGLRKALRRAGARLACRWDGAGVELSCAHVATMEVDALLTPITVRDARHVNHLVLLGSGELEGRLVADVYADAQGGVSQTQSLFGADLVEAVYELSSVNDADELVEEGMERLAELQSASPVEMSLEGIRSGLDVGDLIRASNDATSVEAVAEVTRVVVRIEGGRISTTYDCGAASISGPVPGPPGKDGKDGAGVGIESVLYAVSATEAKPSSGWSPSPPAAVPEGSWLWARTIYTDGTETAIRSKQGRTGPQGPEGPEGPKGEQGVQGAPGTSVAVQSVSKVGGITTVVLADGSGTQTLAIADGEDGADGVPGAAGYVHTAWATSADGSAGFSTTVSAGKTHLGVYTDHEPADSTDPSDYSWSLIKGAKGDTGAQGPQGAAGPQGATGSQGPAGSQGPQGATGVGVSAIEEQYYLSTSATSPTGGSWQTSQPQWQEGRHIWTRSKVAWTDGTTTHTAPVLAKAVNGANSSAASAQQAASRAQADVDASRSWYAECSTAANVAAKAATIVPATDAFALAPGRTVLVRFSATNTAAVASLTLDVDGTGARPVKTLYNQSLSNLYHASHLAAGITYQCVYDGSVWIVSQNVNVDTYDRVRHNTAVRAAEAISSGRMACGTASGYRALAGGASFDAAYPLLLVTTNMGAGTVSTWSYEAYPSVNAALTGTVQSGGAGRMLYLKGTLSGGTFTIAQTNWLTTVVPASADGMTYIPLGIMSSASNLYFKPSPDLWGFEGGRFQRLDRAALGVATATAQHFWDDAEGAHVTQATQAEWQASHAGPNSLWNSLGMLFRDGLSNLLGILSGPSTAERGVAVYDGEGNDASNIVASFTGAGSVIGRTTGQNVEVTPGGIALRDALAVVVRLVNLSASAGLDFLDRGFLRAGKGEPAMWLHANGSRVSIGTKGTQPTREQIQITDNSVVFESQTGGDIVIDLGDGSAGSGGRIVAPKLGGTPVARIEEVAGRAGYGDPVDITGHGPSDPYAVPSDGIVWAEANWRQGAYTQCIVSSASGAELFTVQQASPGTGSNASTAAPVFAGMRVHVNINPSVPYGTARFIPYA